MFPLSDSTKKFAILVPTALLPRPWRVSARRKLLADHELAKARKADLLIIAHPKSGNTWLKVMLSRLYQIRYGLPASVIVTSDELARRNADIPRIVATNGCYSYECAVGDRLQAGAPDNELRHKPVLFLPRHPADIAVSWYFQFTKRQSAPKQELINHAIAHPIDRRTISLWDFVRHSDIGLPFLIRYLNTWEQNIAHLDRSLMVRYEELRGTPEAAIRKIVDFYGASFTDDEIRQAVEFGSFDNLRQLESKGFFRQGGLTLRNPSDPESFKVRRGKVGGYRDYFSSAQLEELDGLIDETLSPTLGYTTQDQGMPLRAVN